MHKHQLYINLFTLTSAMAFVACSDEAVNDVTSPIVPEVGEKTPIVLSVGGIDAAEATTRAVITDGTGKEMSAFDVAANIFMIMQSEYTQYAPADYPIHDTKYNVTRGNVAAGQGDITFTDNNKRYWDDAHGRSSQLSIWAYAQKGQPTWQSCTFQEIESESDIFNVTETTYNTATKVWPWQTKQIYPAIKVWSVGNPGPNQTAETIIYQDLLYSNNLSFNSAKNWQDNRLKFADGKFPTSGDSKIEMYFYHAMSKITINIIAGGGFKSDLSDFTLKNNTNNQKTIDKLHGFNTKGLFNIKDGEFQTIHNHDDITSIPCVDLSENGGKVGYQLEALIIPNIHEFMNTHGGSDTCSCFVQGKKNNVMLEFTVDNNTYKITSGQLFDALSSADGVTKKPSNEDPVYIPMEAGKNYVFTFNIGKKQINNLTATLAPWENVEAELTPSNARIKLKLEEGRGDAITNPADIYRAADNAATITDDHESYNWTTGYADNKNVFTNSSGSWKLTTDWYWPNNQTYYHFRAIQPSETVIKTNTSTTPNEDYVELTSGSSYTDVVWGAPMRDVADNEVKDDFKFIYNTENGFNVKNSDVDAAKSQIYQAIGPTEDRLKLTLFHMMSDLTFKIKTTTDEDKVKLVDGDNKTEVMIYNYSPTGKVLLGTGKVIPVAKSSDDILSVKVDWNSESPSGTHVYKFGVVPQDLTGVELHITTPDGNRYVVDLANVKGSVSNENIKNPYSPVSGSSSAKYVINHWYPGFKYDYTFTLTKMGITNLSATIVQWEEVEADQTVQIK